MAFNAVSRADLTVKFSWNEITGAIGDSVTVLPLVVAITVLTDLSLAVMLIWFGIFQVVWGLYYGAPISVEPMKALAALLLAGSITTEEYLLAGVLLGVILLGVGTTGTLSRISHYIGSPVVRGIQFGVALVLLETGVRLGVGDPGLAALATVIALVLIVLGYWNLTAIMVLVAGSIVAVFVGGLPEPGLPPIDGMFLVTTASFSVPAIEATVAQLAMSVGNAALAASVLMADYFGREVSADELSNSMGVMNLVAIPFGGLPMCHGSGGIAGKYAFGARTAGANIVLGVGYIAIALGGAGLVAVYPVSMLGVILALIGLQLARTSLQQTRASLLVIGIGLLGVAINLGAAFLVGTAVHLYRERRGKR